MVFLRKAMGSKRLWTGVAVVMAIVGLCAWAAWPAKPTEPDWSHDYDVAARAPEPIPPGTVIDRTAPPGWSHLVIKSLPRVDWQHRTGLPDVTIRMASWMFTAFVADVRADGPSQQAPYRLRVVALGLGTSVDRRDTVITPETAGHFGVELNWVTRSILTQGYEVQRRSVVVVHGPTLGLVDAPVLFHRAGKNGLIRYRYALLVENATGKLDVLMWPLEPNFAEQPTEVFRLDPGTIDEAELIPDASQFIAGIPTQCGFAVDRVPKHRDRLALPSDLRDLAARTRFTPDEALALETGLRVLVSTAASQPAHNQKTDGADPFQRVKPRT